MSNKEKPEIGSITWFDLTVPDAEKVKDFYSQVLGWKPAPVSMGDYNDFNMNSSESRKTNAGICHKRGGKVLSGPKEMSGYGKFCVIEDPAGAVCNLFEPK